MLAVGITVAIIALRDQFRNLGAYGLLGVFVISLVSNATVIIPVPGLAVVFAVGGALPPIQVGLVAALGMTLGELTGYLAGYGGGVVIENRQRYEQIRRYMGKYGLGTIIVLAAIPNPFFDVAGLAAGALKMPLWKFLLACFVGKAIKAVAFAYAGAGSAPFIADLFRRWF